MLSLLLQTANDPAKWALLSEDPESVMAGARLTKWERTAQASRDANRIQKVMGGKPPLMIIIVPF